MIINISLFKKLFYLLIVFNFYTLSAQDTINVMQYNLLNYGNFTSYCTAENNSLEDKTTYLHTIIDNEKPDIFGVNELSKDSIYADKILNEVMKDINPNYERAYLTNHTNSYLINMIYYDSKKLTLHSQKAVLANVRDINIYTFYYNSPEILRSRDTCFLNVIVTHLKAGSSNSDIDDRALMTSTLMNYIETNNITGNIMLMGDFNVYTSSEEAFQNVTNWHNQAIRFYDPINKLGAWNNNDNYSLYHTQSTHTAYGCAASGGMDDRFDFILISDDILYSTSKINYIQNSYKAIGQDGQRFNSSLISPENTSENSELINALYNMSDHLPVKLQLFINQTPVSNILRIDNLNLSSFINSNGFLNFSLENNNKQKITNIEIIDLTGKIILSRQYYDKDNFYVPISEFNMGIYLLKISNNKNFIIKKFAIL